MPTPPLSVDALAAAGFNPDALSVRDAQEIIARCITPLASREDQPLLAALGRVLAADVISPISVPAHDNSAMDGYAFNADVLAAHGPTELDVIGTIYAGRPSSLTPGAGQCVRIMTGAVMPVGCDSVIPQELVAAIAGERITIGAGSIARGDNRRFKGEDLMQGQPALRQGRVLRPADLGLLASLGIAQAPVRARLRVACFSTGDELRSLGQQLDPGCVYDSNRYTLFGMLTRLGVEVIDMGIVADDPDALESALRQACASADAIITSGGVSVGAADYTRAVMARLGQVGFWKIGMRPGRPLAFGCITSGADSALLFGLPGNPVAVMVSFYFFVRDALLRLAGGEAPLQPLRVRSQAAIRKKPGRTEYQRGIVGIDGDGQLSVRITGAQGSGILRSMSEANCMVILSDEQGNVAAGDSVEIVLFDGLV